MTIQLPILLWTVITFCLMILILNNLLFKPMLAFMDKRQQRIDSAAAKKADYDKALADAESKLAAFREDEAKHLSQLARDEIADARKDAERILTDAARERNHRIEAAKNALSDESRKIVDQMDESVEKLAEAYLSGMV